MLTPPHLSLRPSSLSLRPIPKIIHPLPPTAKYINIYIYSLSQPLFNNPIKPDFLRGNNYVIFFGNNYPCHPTRRGFSFLPLHLARTPTLIIGLASNIFLFRDNEIKFYVYECVTVIVNNAWIDFIEFLHTCCLAQNIGRVY